MERRKLGKSGLEVSRLCFGGNVFGWTVDEAASFQLLDAFTSAGLNFIDTSDFYSAWKPCNKGGESETIIGNWLRRSGKREQVVIATKVGLEMGPGDKGLSRAYIMRAVEASLRRLQTDHIDLYQSHTDDKDTPLEETLGTYAELVKAGKVRAIGASNYSAERLTEALRISRENGWPRYESLQPNYNLFDREEFETKLEATCAEYGLGVIPYYSLASGFLTGKYRSAADVSKSVRGEGVAKKYLNERGFRILKALDDVSARLKAKPASVALAWLMARPSVTAPIASATGTEQVGELVAAVKLTLDEAAIEVLNKASGY